MDKSANEAIIKVAREIMIKNYENFDLNRAFKEKTCGKKLSQVCQMTLDGIPVAFTPKNTYERFLEVEKDKTVLRKELKLILKLAYESNQIMDPVNFNIFQMSDDLIEKTPLFEKYKLFKRNILVKKYSILNMIRFTFPDLFYAVTKKYPNTGVNAFRWLTLKYKNFQPIHANIGLLSLLPKDRKYGGFVKILLLCVFDDNPTDHLEFELAVCLNIYRHSFVAQGAREQWFPKLGITEDNCTIWSQVFNEQFPHYADIHEVFDQIA